MSVWSSIGTPIVGQEDADGGLGDAQREPAAVEIDVAWSCAGPRIRLALSGPSGLAWLQGTLTPDEAYQLGERLMAAATYQGRWHRPLAQASATERAALAAVSG